MAYVYEMQGIPAYDYTRTIVTVMKDEAPYMLDWIAYHLSIGFTHFVILTNDCTDGTDKIARKLSRAGLVTHKNNPAPHPRGPQKTGYMRMLKLEPLQQAEWLMALDADEYLRIDQGGGTLDGLFELVGQNIKAISFLWQLFGNNGVRSISSTPVYQEFTHSQIPLQTRPYETTSIKTLYQNQYFARIGTHRPIEFDQSKISDFLWIDADGVPMIQYYLQRHWRAYENGLGFGTILGRINHYALRSLDAFLVKWARGFVHPNAPTVRGKGQPQDYWKLFNWNQYQEPNILPHQQRAQAIGDDLRSVENIKKLEERAHDQHQERARAIRQAHPESYEALLALGSSQINEPMPDFSMHGSPKTLAQESIDPKILFAKAAHSSLLPEELINQYKEINTQP